MNWGKLVLWIFLLALIVGTIIGIVYLFLFIFVLVFNFFTDIMIIKGADPRIASVVALILTVFTFYEISKNSTVNNYMVGRTQEWWEKKKI